MFFLFGLVQPTLGQHQSKGEHTSISSKKKKNKRKKARLPNIDLSHWKVTLPINNEQGKPYEIEPPEIFDFAKNETAKPYMYIDSTAGAIVFYAMPTESTTKNTKYSRCELREQMEPGSNQKNWTFAQGGHLKATMEMDSATRNNDGKYHRSIVMQIHGRLTDEQKNLIGADDNNAPPILKVYWDNGRIRVKTKILKNPNASDEEILHEDAWIDDEGFNFDQVVGFKKFTLEVKVSEGKMVLILNNNEHKVYENNDLKRWGVFENYFKVGNYFQSRDDGSFSKVMLYKLTVDHDEN